jgi:Thioredoxin
MSRPSTMRPAAGFSILPLCVTLAVGETRKDARSAGPDQAVAIISGTPIRAAKLDELIGNQLLRLETEEYNVRRRVLDEHIATLLLEAEAARRRVGVAELVQSEIDDKARPITAEETRLAYEGARERFGALDEPAALREIEASMRRQRVAVRRAQFIDQLKAKDGVKVLLEPPRIDLGVMNTPSKGPQNAAVTIVEYSDYQCPYCARVQGP